MYRNPQHQKARLEARRLAPHWRFVALGCCIAASTSVALAGPCGGGHCSCPGSTTSDQVGTSPGVDTWLTLTSFPLLPGSTQFTLGTNLISSPGLAGTLIKNVTAPFATGSGDTTGTVTQSVVNTDNGSCAMYYQAAVDITSSVCIDALQIAGFKHPKLGLVGDFRNDLVPGGVGSTTVTRSPKPGTSIRFNVLVCPGQVSRPLFLDTSVDEAKNTGTLRVRGADGTLSQPIPSYVPFQP
jgi:hypothetical protein